ncbi:hypothetical protein ACFC1L_40165 [Streptomyces sp. NPDC056210]|uniref:hypothetical protein n=1 Tax=Streptomyces sp. NPDC056210 TaxID=3345746 RepID=UPI0035DAB4C6
MSSLTEDEKEALSFLQRNGAVAHRMGFKRKTLEQLAERGYVELIIMSGGRKWVASMTDEGKPVAEENEDFRKIAVVDAENATSLVSVELFKTHPQYGLESVFERMNYSSYENFVESVKSWAGDRSELSTRDIDGADYRELYTHFCGLMGKEEKK